MEDHTPKNIWATQIVLYGFKKKKDTKLGGGEPGRNWGKGEYDQNTSYEITKELTKGHNTIQTG